MNRSLRRHYKHSRRQFLRNTAFGMGICSVPWLRALASHDTSEAKRQKSVIMLWLDGGPSTIDLWDLKPRHTNGGPISEIETVVPGIRISEHLPKLAQHMDKMAIVRSMTSTEGDHGRASYLTRTGYRPVGAIQFPAVGAVLAHELDEQTSTLPSFVSIAPGRNVASIGGGFLGPRFSPLKIAEHAETAAGLKVPDLSRRPGIDGETQKNRQQILRLLEKQFRVDRSGRVVDAIHAANEGAIRMMTPQAKSAFELDEEPKSIRESYGRGLFGQGCLLARRLVERGIACVEVTLGGWDTHQENFRRVEALSRNLDTAFASLLHDLNDRGLMENTLVVCMGEFGRTPKINPNQGRDHWPKSWAAVLAGGIEGGQVIGETNHNGTAVKERPVTVPDLIATVARSVGVDPMKQNMSNVGRPIRVADPTATPIKELL